MTFDEVRARIQARPGARERIAAMVEQMTARLDAGDDEAVGGIGD